MFSNRPPACLPPSDLLRHRLQHHFLYFHCPLHGGFRVRVHAPHGLSPSPLQKRTSHLLIQPDISCANDMRTLARLTYRETSCTLRVPAVYLGWANSVFLAFFAFNRINNLRISSVAFSPIPTAPTKPH